MPDGWSKGDAGQSVQHTGIARCAFTATYDAAGQRVGATEDGVALTYAYDGLNRLIAATRGTTPYTYTYAAAGNRLTAREGTTATTATSDAANQLATLNGIPLASGANGTLLSDGTTTYAYDSLDRLIRATSGLTTTWK